MPCDTRCEASRGLALEAVENPIVEGELLLVDGGRYIYFTQVTANFICSLLLCVYTTFQRQMILRFLCRQNQPLREMAHPSGVKFAWSEIPWDMSHLVDGRGFPSRLPLNLVCAGFSPGVGATGMLKGCSHVYATTKTYRMSTHLTRIFFSCSLFFFNSPQRYLSESCDWQASAQAAGSLAA